MRFEELALVTARGTVKYAFKGPLTVLTGPVGVGKSTLLESIKWCLGGQARIAPVLSHWVSSVQLTVRIEGRSLVLERRIGAGQAPVRVLDGGGDEVGVFPTTRSADGETIGDFLMRSLGLPVDAYAVTKSRSARISFNNILSFLYVEQREIDRSIARNSETYSEPSRKTTFELLFNLTDETILKLRKTEKETVDRRDEAGQRESAIRQFLGDSRVRPYDDVSRLLAEQRAVRAQAHEELDRLRAEMRPANTGDVPVLKDMVLDARRELSKTIHNEEAIRTQLNEHTSLHVSNLAKQANVARVNSSADFLAPIQFVICPRCAQSISKREYPAGCCSLCLQPEPQASRELVVRAADEIARLSNQRDEIATLIESDKRELKRIADAKEIAERNLAKLEQLLDEKTTDFVNPRLERFTDLSSSVARADALIAELERSALQWDRVQDLTNTRVTLAESVDTIAKQRQQAESSLKNRKTDLMNSLSADYQDTVREFGVPSVESAFLSPTNYLPYANGERFDRLSTGGITTGLVTAYWLTLFSAALREPAYGYPSVLMIDTPRKSIGIENAKLADELYRQLDILAEAYQDRIQVIVCDNDVPRSISKLWQEIRFSYESPSITSIPHPGPDAVKTLDAD